MGRHAAAGEHTARRPWVGGRQGSRYTSSRFCSCYPALEVDPVSGVPSQRPRGGTGTLSNHSRRSGLPRSVVLPGRSAPDSVTRIALKRERERCHTERPRPCRHGADDLRIPNPPKDFGTSRYALASADDSPTSRLSRNASPVEAARSQGAWCSSAAYSRLMTIVPRSLIAVPFWALARREKRPPVTSR